MDYATYSDFAERYPTRLGAAEVTSHFLAPAARRLDAMLAGWFSVPFSANNVTARDLTLDLAQLLILQRSKSPQDGEALARSVTERVAALRNGSAAMVTDSGDALHRSGEGGVWSSTRAYKPVFDLRDAPAQRVDPERLRDEGVADR